MLRMALKSSTQKYIILSSSTTAGVAMATTVVEAMATTVAATATSGSKTTATEATGGVEAGEDADQHQHQAEPSPVPSQEQLPSNPCLTISTHCEKIKAPLGLVAY